MDAAVLPNLAANTVRLQLHALAYNLGNFMRTLAMPKAAGPWSLTSLREKLIKIGAKVVGHGRYVTFQMAEVAVSRQMFQEILSLIATAGTARASMRSPGGRMSDRPRRHRYALIKAKARVPAPRARQSSDFARQGSRPGRHLLCLWPKSETMALVGTGIWRMSV